MKRIAIVASAEMTIRAFFVGHIAALCQRHRVTVIVNGDDRRFLEDYGLDVEVLLLRIERRIAPLADLRALLRLVRLFRVRHFDAVCSITPKAGLLTTVAAKLAGVPVRIHTFTGQVWATSQGARRALLKAFDRVIASSATHLLADSDSQREFLVAQGVVAPERIRVLAHGSICGVDIARFCPDGTSRDSVRRELGVAENDRLLLYVGRLVRDKGVLDLARAFVMLSAEHRPELHLLFVGPDEGGVGPELRRICGSHGLRLHIVAYSGQPERFMAAADVYCLPSYREGFGMTLMEAASVGVPGVGSRVYGITDAIEEGVTGLFHEPGNIASLASTLGQLLDHPDLRHAMGRAARERAARLFDRELVTAAFVEYVNQAVS